MANDDVWTLGLCVCIHFLHQLRLTDDNALVNQHRDLESGPDVLDMCQEEVI